MTWLISSIEDVSIDQDYVLIDWGDVRPSVTRAEVQAEIERFRGAVLSKAYSLEHQLDALLTWHLFKLRIDDSSEFFSTYILKDGAFGLQLKVKLACRVIWMWADEAEASAMTSRLRAAKAWRDRVAHWPVRLRPIFRRNGQGVGFEPRMVKGDEEHILTFEDQSLALDLLVQAESDAKCLCHRIFELNRDFPEE